MLEMVRIGLWATLTLKDNYSSPTQHHSLFRNLPLYSFDVETSNNFCEGQDNKSTLVGIIHSLLFIQLASIVNEVNRVVISGE